MNQNFSFEQTKIVGVYLIDPMISFDKRGYLMKDFSTDIFREKNIPYVVKETLYSSSHKGVLRGIHFQRTNQQAKLLRCLQGRIFDVCVDLRKDSVTFGQWMGVELSEENHRMFLIPEGCGHGFCSLEESLICYKCKEGYVKDTDDGIRYDDERLDIKWPKLNGVTKVISERDRGLQTLDEFVERYGGL